MTTKIIRPGRISDGDIFCKIELKEVDKPLSPTLTTTVKNLSITGVIGPKSNGDARGGCGQIDMEFAHRDPSDNDGRYNHPITTDQIQFAPGWNADLWLNFLDVWKDYHNNDLQAGCTHQRANGWNKRPIDPEKPLQAYGKFFSGQRSASWNMLAWISPDEHPFGLLGKPCEVCGYKYGTAWQRLEIPQTVIDFINSLPETDKNPAWV